MSERIDAFALRVSQDEFFLASALASYARSEDLDDEGLASVLGCTAKTLALLRLCRRPRPELPDFRADLSRVAERFDIDPGILAQVIRRADVLAALQHSANEAGLLMAARDRIDHQPADEDEGTD
jgi:hypothetical protein